MDDKNIIFNYTIEKYKKKYRNRGYRLLKYTKDEVEKFDKLASKDIKVKNFLLKGRKWTLIGDTYYEIPRPIRFTWFRNLNTGIQIATCVLAAGVVATAVAVPLVIINANNNSCDIIIDPKKQDEASVKFEKTTNEGNFYIVSPKSEDKVVSSIEKVYIGDDLLKAKDEYTFKQENKSVELMIKKEALNNHKGTIKVLPKVEDVPPTEYLIKFLNYDGSELQSCTVKEGETPKYTGANPTKDPEPEKYTYKWTGEWDKPLAPATENTSYTATFKLSECLITFKDDSGKELQKSKQEVGKKAIYSGDTPTKDPTESQVFTFSGWDKELAIVNDVETYTAQFEASTRKYIVKFVDDDGTVLQSSEVEYGSKPTAPSDPTKAPDVNYDYEFNGWDHDIVEVKGDATYTATYKYTKCNIKFVNYDGTVLQESKQPVGQTAEYSGAEPTKPSTEQKTYTFTGWDKTLAEVTDVKTYTAQFSESTRKYTITFYDEDGSTILQSSEVEYGTVPQYTGTTPTKASDTNYDYAFDKWDTEPVAVTGDASYTAQYKYSACLIKFVNYDGTVLQESKVEVDTIPYYSGNEPQREQTESKVYKFSGWDKDLATVTDVETYTAQFSESTRQYTIEFVNGDGVTIESKKVDYGTVPTYTGSTPTKTSDLNYDYVWNKKWDKELVAVTGDATYTATFDKSACLIKFVNYNGDVLQESKQPVGETAKYTSETPTKPSTEQKTYTFTGWDETLGEVTDIKTYTAQFSESTRKYTITFYDEDGSTVLQSSQVEYGTVPQYTGTTPTKASDTNYDYAFDKWDTEPVAVTGDASYKAQYKYSACLIKFVNDDGETEVETPKKVAVGTVPTCSTTPTKESTAEYSYTFNGWDKTPVAVTDVATYTATYTSTKRSYNVTAVSLDTSKGTVEYPQSAIEYGSNATVKATAITGNKFVGWYDNNQGTGTAVSTDASYTFSVTGTTTLYAKFETDTRTDKEKFVDTAKTFYSNFKNSFDTYTLANLTINEFENFEHSKSSIKGFTELKYNSPRTRCVLKYDVTESYASGINVSFETDEIEMFSSYLFPTSTNISYVINDNYISYVNTNTKPSEYIVYISKIKINSKGYIEEMYYSEYGSGEAKLNFTWNY